LAGLCLLALTSCLPEETTQEISWSPTGQYLAIQSERQGVRILDLERGHIRRLEIPQFIEGNLEWSPDGRLLAGVTRRFGPQQVVVSDFASSWTVIGESLFRCENPVFLGPSQVMLVSTPNGQRRLFRSELESDNLESVGALRSVPVIRPALSPDKSQVAFTTFRNLRPQLFLLDLNTGVESPLTSETHPLRLLTSVQPIWSPDSHQIYYGRDPRTEAEFLRDFERGDLQNPDPLARAVEMREIRRVIPKNGANFRVLVAGSHIQGFDLGPGGRSLIYSSGGRFRRQDLRTREERSMAFESFSLQRFSMSASRDRLAFAVAGQLLATADSDLRSSQFVFLDATDKFLLAEEYFQRGRSGRTMDLYRELAGSITTSNPEQADFVMLANQVRLGRTREAVAALERLTVNEALPPEIPREAVWRILGFAYLLDFNDSGRAQFCLEQANRAYQLRTLSAEEVDSSVGRLVQRILDFARPEAPRELPAEREWLMENQLTASALAILSTGRTELIQAFRRALRARLEANVPATIRTWGRLLELAPELPEVRREYIRALEGFDSEVYYFTPSQRPFQPTQAQRASFLERFLSLVPEGREADSVRLELFLLSIESRNFSRARALILESLRRDGPRAMEGIPEAFEDFLEKPETQPWLEPAMERVFLDPEIRTLIESHLTDPETRLTMILAAMKSALLRRLVDVARTEGDSASALMSTLTAGQRTPGIQSLSARLHVLKSREAALRGLYGEAVNHLERAANDYLAADPSSFEYYYEIQFVAELYRTMLRDQDGNFLRDRVEREATLGDDLMAPNWDVPRLRRALLAAVDEFDKAGDRSLHRSIAAYDAGVAFGKLRQYEAAHAAFNELVTQGDTPAFVRRRALVELASTEEFLHDPMNAAGRWSQLANEAELPTILRAWLGFRIAQSNLRLGYRIPEARAALQQIIDQVPDSALAEQSRAMLSTMAE
jgi:tetratricopeptide (TPR) repeat protein